MKRLQFIFLFIVFLSYGIGTKAKHVISIMPTCEDMTPIVREALEQAQEDEIKLVFYKGCYRFLPDYATDQHTAITNHDNGYKKIIFHAKGFKSVEIIGNDSEFIFHGQCAPFVFEDCEKVSVSDISIDWDIPFLFQGELVDFNKEEDWRELKPLSNGYSWKVENNEITFPNIDGFSFKSLGATYPFDKNTKDVVYGAKGMHSHPERVEQLPNGNLRMYEKINYLPPIGTILASKGNINRYAPAFYAKASKNIHADSVIVHHALGMGFLFERSENITLTDCGVYLSEGSDRVASSIADATHFCNCKGDILVEDCRFENMLDDGTNVHGTYVVVNKILNDSTVQIALQHEQQKGFIFAEKGDKIWFLHQPEPKRKCINIVSSTSILNETYSTITFEKELPEELKKGDVLENRTWNPGFTMRGCTIGNHRARNIVLKSPWKTVIENNHFFSSDMASILFRGETLNWFESGAVKNVTIQNNHFSYCTHGASDQALLYITPRHGQAFQSPDTYDSNIRFINNAIETFGNRIVWADKVKNLLIKDNTIIKTNTAAPLYPDAPMMEFSKCKNVKVYDNSYQSNNPGIIKTDKISKESLKLKGNEGF